MTKFPEIKQCLLTELSVLESRMRDARDYFSKSNLVFKQLCVIDDILLGLDPVCDDSPLYFGLLEVDDDLFGLYGAAVEIVGELGKFAMYMFMDEMFDGRSFRDCEWNYNKIRDLVAKYKGA